MVKPRKASGSLGETMVLPTQLDPARVAAAATVEPGQPKRVPDDRMDGVPVLDMHEVQALPEQLRLVIVLDPQALAGMDGAEASLEPTDDFAILHALPFTPA